MPRPHKPFAKTLLITGLLIPTLLRAQSYVFVKIVDDTTPRPDGGGYFFAVNPSFDGNVVVFNQGQFGAGIPAPDSIWAADVATGALTKLADTTSAIPGGNGTFAFFEQKLVVRLGQVVFVGADADGKLGLYSVPAAGGDIVRLADTNTAVPGASVNFARFDRGAFSHDGATVVFSGGGGPVNGVYSVLLDGLGLDRVADSNTPVNSNQCDVFPVYLYIRPSISNGAVAFRGQTVFDSSNGFNALYTASKLNPTVGPNCGGPFPSSANSLEKLPGDTTANFHTRFDYGQVDGDTLYFRADNPNGPFGGIFSVPAASSPAGGSIAPIVDSTTLLPDYGAVSFVNNFTFAASMGNVLLHVTDSTNRSSLFLAGAEPLARIIGTGDTLDGLRERYVESPAPTAITGREFAFIVGRSDFYRALYVGRTPPPANP